MKWSEPTVRAATEKEIAYFRSDKWKELPGLEDWDGKSHHPAVTAIEPLEFLPGTDEVERISVEEMRKRFGI